MTEAIKSELFVAGLVLLTIWSVAGLAIAARMHRTPSRAVEARLDGFAVPAPHSAGYTRARDVASH